MGRPGSPGQDGEARDGAPTEPASNPMFPEAATGEESGLGFVEGVAQFPGAGGGPPVLTQVVLCGLGDGKVTVKVRRPAGRPHAGTVGAWEPPPVSLAELRLRFGLPRPA